MKATTDDTQQAAELLEAIAHPLRLRILLALTEKPTMNASVLQTELKLDISHQVIKMRDRGILTNERRSKEVYQYLADPAIAEAIQILLNR